MNEQGVLRVIIPDRHRWDQGPVGIARECIWLASEDALEFDRPTSPVCINTARLPKSNCRATVRRTGSWKDTWDIRGAIVVHQGRVHGWGAVFVHGTLPCATGSKPFFIVAIHLHRKPHLPQVAGALRGERALLPCWAQATTCSPESR